MSKKNESVRRPLLMQKKNGYDLLSKKDLEGMDEYCSEYLCLMNRAKTEREFVRESVNLAETAGFKPLSRCAKLKPGDKVYKSIRDKGLCLAVIGKEPLERGVNIVAAHIDSPRLDLKPNPLSEEGGMAYFKTHYYGGIKKYQWVAIPLELRGVVALKSGQVIDVCVGAEPGDPVFTITDLLPHLGADQMKKNMAEGVTGEALRALLGSRPDLEDEGENRIKLTVLGILNEKYGIEEEDFLSAELSLVPGFRASELGFDRSMLAAYGHDDRVCSFAGLKAMLELDVPEKTAVCILADKEEIGSCGVSGTQSQAYDTFIEDLCEQDGSKLRVCYENSFCLSCDVTNAHDPLYADVDEIQNATEINYGVGICKYTGARGKSGASDASAEVMGRLRAAFARDGILWQSSDMGKVDKGGGGTVAVYFANRNIDTVDAGVPVLSMHAPYEVVSKLDTFMTYKAAKAIYRGV